MTAGYVYAAIDHTRPNTIKVGHTRQRPEDRVRQCSGAAAQRMSLLFALPSPDSRCSESLAHQMLDDLGCRVMTRRELFETNALTVGRILEAAVAQTPVPPAPVPAEGVLTAKNTFWQHLLSTPVEFDGNRIPVGRLLFLALKHTNAQARAAKLGFVLLCWDRVEPEYHIDVRKVWVQRLLATTPNCSPVEADCTLYVQ